MLSICIPVYNYDIRSLVRQLSDEIKTRRFIAQIVVIDDKSSDQFKALNEDIIEMDEVLYIELPQNIGRAAIRNKFLEYTIHNTLLFLDCDSVNLPQDFIYNYLNTDDAYKVVCGGRIYQANQPASKFALHWIYGTKCESKSKANRDLAPYNSFMTNNFLIEKSVLQQIKFNEKITDYGHEDTIFGYQLQLQNTPILHLDNPVTHGELVSNKVFVEKSIIAVKNLINIKKESLVDAAFFDTLPLHQAYLKLKKRKLIGLLTLNKNLLRSLTITFSNWGIPSIFLLNLTKLAYYCHKK